MIENGPITEARAHGTWGTGNDEAALHAAALYAIANAAPNPNCIGEDGVTTQWLVHIAHPGGSDYTGDALIQMTSLPDVGRVRYRFDSGQRLRIGSSTSEGAILGGAGGNSAPNITFGVGDETAGSGRDKGRVSVDLNGSNYTKKPKAKLLIPKQPYMAIEDFEIMGLALNDPTTSPAGKPDAQDNQIPAIWTNAASHIRIERCGGVGFPYGYGLIGVNAGAFVYVYECDTDDDGVLARMELVGDLHDFEIVGNVGRHGKDVVNISTHAFRMWNGLVKGNIGLGQEYGINIRQQTGGGFGKLDSNGNVIAGTEVVVQGNKIKNDNRAKRLTKNGDIQPSFYWNEGPGQQPFGPGSTPRGVLVSGTIGDESIVAFEGGLNGAASGSVTVPNPPGSSGGGGGGGDSGVGPIPARTIGASLVNLPVDGLGATKSTAAIDLAVPLGVQADDVLIAAFAWEDAAVDAPFTAPAAFDLMTDDHKGTSAAGTATRCYLTSTQANKGSSTGAAQSSALGTPSATPTGGPIIGDLAVTRGSAQVATGIASLASLSAQKLYLGQFRSPPLAGAGGSIAAHTWTLAVAGHESGGPANMKIAAHLRVEKADGTTRGVIYDSATGLGSELPAAAPPPGEVLSLTGSSVASVATTDRLVLEVWAVGTQTQATSYNVQPTRYNGTTDVADGVASSSAAAYLETPQTDLFSSVLSTVKSSVHTHVVTDPSTEPTSYTFTGPSAIGGAAALIAVRGWDPAAVSGVGFTTAKGHGTAASVADIATAEDLGAALLIVAAHGTQGRTWPSGFAELYSVQRDPGTAPRHQISASVKSVPTAGTVTGLTATLSQAADWIAVAIPLDPVGGGGVPPSQIVLADTSLDTDLGRVRTLVTLDPAPSTGQTISLTRKHPSGVTVTVRGADHLDPGGSQALIYDYEVPIGRQVVYQATMYDTDGTTVLGVSDLGVILWETSEDWISSPLHPALAMPALIAGLPSQTFDRRVGIHQVIGRPAPVTTTDVIGSASGALSVLTLDAASERLMREMVAYPTPLLIRSADLSTGSLFIQPTEATNDRTSTLRDEPSRVWTLPFVEVDRPTDDASGGPITCQTIIDLFATCADVIAGVADCLALIEAPAGVTSGVRVLVPWRGE